MIIIIFMNTNICIAIVNPSYLQMSTVAPFTNMV